MTRLQKIAASAVLFIAVMVEVAIATTTTYSYKDSAGHIFLIQIFGSGPYYTGMVLENSSGTEVATSGAPLRIDPTGTTTQPVNCVSGCANSGGTAVVDESAFTYGTTPFTPVGGFYQTTATSNALTNGQSGSWQMTANRAGFVNLRNASGTEVGTSGNPLQTVSAPLAGVSTAQLSSAAGHLTAKASAGSVVSISGSVASGSYVMLFNATTDPADGAVTPLKCYGPTASAGPFVVGWGTGPVLAMSTGITLVLSSTGCFTKTELNAAFLSVEYQ